MKRFLKILGVFALFSITLILCFGIALYISKPEPCEKTFCQMTEAERLYFCPTRVKLPMKNGGSTITYFCESSRMIMETHDLSEESTKEMSAKLEYYASYGSQIKLICQHASGITFEIIGDTND